MGGISNLTGVQAGLVVARNDDGDRTINREEQTRIADELRRNHINYHLPFNGKPVDVVSMIASMLGVSPEIIYSKNFYQKISPQTLKELEGGVQSYEDHIRQPRIPRQPEFSVYKNKH